MATVAVVYWLPAGGLMSQADWLGPEIGGHWRCLCIHRVKRVNSRSALSSTMAVQLYLPASHEWIRRHDETDGAHESDKSHYHGDDNEQLNEIERVLNCTHKHALNLINHS